MNFRDLYNKNLDRKVNPAVSASDLSEATVNTEINEYVFTQDIIDNLNRILTNVKSNKGSHVGIWINGYFGSGKSHFLKYTNYCLKKEYSERAFNRLIEETRKEFNGKDPLSLEQKGVNISELLALKKWYIEKAQVEMIMFNIGDVHNVNDNQSTTFTTIFWNKFNEIVRGYTSINLPYAQYLEKTLDEHGKFKEFKDYVKSQGIDYERRVSSLATGSLDMALEMAKHVDPQLSIDVIREKIIRNDINVSVEAFASEIREYLEDKGDNARIMFFVDEVSQFIGENRHLLLQLQSLVEYLYKACGSKVWIACTAQQTLKEVVYKLGGTDNPDDEIGKILGRFEVRASLQGTSVEYITQRRILEKKDEVALELGEMFDSNKSKLDAQFILPDTYKKFVNKEDFIDYYPFVPYQFQLIMKVLNSFVQMSYVDKQVKGNERSLLNITFSIAKETADWEVGEFIPFDKFYGAILRGSMQHLGYRAYENARMALDEVKNNDERDFYRRVANILFMICNLSDVDKPTFPATIDNVVTLLMTRVDENRAIIKERVNRALQYLIKTYVIRKDKTENGLEIYKFHTLDEAQVAELIKNQQVDSATYLDELYKIISKHFELSNKENHATRSFNIGFNVDTRSFLSSRAEVFVDFIIESRNTPEEYMFNNNSNHLVFFLAPQWQECDELRENFNNFCKVQRYSKEPVINEERKKTRKIFQDRANDMYNKDIVPQLKNILDTCVIISGQSILSRVELGQSKGKERYKNAMKCHMSRAYEYAKIVDSPETPRTSNDLSTKIRRNIDSPYVDALNEAETKIVDFLDRQFHDVSVADVIQFFEKMPYGWSDLATIFTLNELVRRNLYRYNYNNNPNISREDTARLILKESNRFTVEKATAISQNTINKFKEAWQDIFNVMSVPGGNDYMEMFRHCRESENSALKKTLSKYNKLSGELGTCPFVSTINEAIECMDNWWRIHEPKEFFETIIRSRETAINLFDSCKQIDNFEEKQFNQYKNIIRFIDDNRDNFSFIPIELQDTVNSIKKIKKDEKPWDNMNRYFKLMRKLDDELKKVKVAIVEEIKSNYTNTFNRIKEYAIKVHVPLDKLVNLDAIIKEKTDTDNFHALKANVDTKAFFNEQIDIINAAIEKDDKPEGISTCKVVSLNTRSEKPIKTEADVDAYLTNLKSEIMRHIKDGQEIIIS